ncbi:MAG TPA: PorP/SprF family type IX secretion system membrane protein [Flavobacteriales bacterium]|nr:PorP/SprF family type IX secretion system membrane protein [Flavobacteriales bacterium]
MKKKLTYIFLLAGFGVNAQQDMVLTNYGENLFVFNPAFTGAERYTHFMAANRLQHLQMKNAPITNILSCNSSISGISSSAGGYIFQDQVGIYNHMGINGSYAYKIENATNGNTLAFGLGVTAENYRLDYNKAELIDKNDPLILQGSQGDWGFNSSFGISWFSEKTKVGISATNLIPVQLDFGAGNVFSYARHYYFLFNQTVELGEASNLGIYTLMSYTQQKPFQAEAHLLYNIYRFSIGAGYRKGDAALLFFGVNIFDELYLNYAYDVTLNALKAGTYGSSEIMLTYKFYYNPAFKKEKPKYNWIRKVPKNSSL